MSSNPLTVLPFEYTPLPSSLNIAPPSPLDNRKDSIPRSSSSRGSMAQVRPTETDNIVSQDLLDSLNVAQAPSDNFINLKKLGGTSGLATLLNLDLATGLTSSQVSINRDLYGPNKFPEKLSKHFFRLYVESFNDLTLIILMIAAVVSLIVGTFEDPEKGWIEGVAILVACQIVALVTSTNDYQKEIQFRALEASADKDARCTVLRNGEILRINPEMLVIGDCCILKSGDGVPADGVMYDGSGMCNESALTGEPEDLKKADTKDPFFLSSCEVTDTGTSNDVKIICIAVGKNSQWGKIKANLSGETESTPLQNKLDEMVQIIGKGGSVAAVLTFIALVAMIWTKHDGRDVVSGIIEAFIIAITIIVVAIPEGLPLAVTISLAYSTSQMLDDNNLIRRLQACETMGNATNICTDKTGTLTENRMTVVEGFFGGKHVTQENLEQRYTPDANVLKAYALNCSINSNVFLIDKDEQDHLLHRPKVIGSATEGALVLLLRRWGVEYQAVRDDNFVKGRDIQFPFNSTKKRSTAIVVGYQGRVKLLCKGASEVVLRDCTHFTDSDGQTKVLDDSKRAEINALIEAMAGRALRTLAIAHKDYPSTSDMANDYMEDPPDASDLILDFVVGIIDPLRSDVKEAVKTAQGAGVMVRMVTGDNIITAIAIARQCGILTGKGETLTKERWESVKNKKGELEALLPNVCAIEGPCFRNLTPKQADLVLQRVQVMARSSPDDKYLMVTRLNGHGLPENQKEWEELNPGRDYVKEKDLFLPGYKQEWASTRPRGGHVVGVTGDGTNDAPALKASDVGLAMGITGTQVAKNASDIIILDDRFSSIVKAIMWGRSVYDNIRRFLQFQLTVNVVALTITFVSAVSGFHPPLNAVMMLWVNLIMDTMGALALGTEKPTLALLDRKPYLRNSPLLSLPMARNICFQSAYQLAMLALLLFAGPEMFDINDGNWCKTHTFPSSTWKGKTIAIPGDMLLNYPPEAGMTTVSDLSDSTSSTCGVFEYVCPSSDNGDCFDAKFKGISGFELTCFDDTCLKSNYDYTHFTFIFNAFVWAQIFNEFNARSIKNDANCFKNIQTQHMFLLIIAITILSQISIVGVGGDFTRTIMLPFDLWLWSVLLGFISVPVGVLMRFCPIWSEENPESFFGYDMPE